MLVAMKENKNSYSPSNTRRAEFFRHVHWPSVNIKVLFSVATTWTIALLGIITYWSGIEFFTVYRVTCIQLTQRERNLEWIGCPFWSTDAFWLSSVNLENLWCFDNSQQNWNHGKSNFHFLHFLISCLLKQWNPKRRFKGKFVSTLAVLSFVV